MTAGVIFFSVQQFDGSGDRGGSSFRFLCCPQTLQKQKAGKRVRKEIKWRRGHRWIRELVKE